MDIFFFNDKSICSKYPIHRYKNKYLMALSIINNGKRTIDSNYN